MPWACENIRLGCECGLTKDQCIGKTIDDYGATSPQMFYFGYYKMQNVDPHAGVSNYEWDIEKNSWCQVNRQCGMQILFLVIYKVGNS